MGGKRRRGSGEGTIFRRTLPDGGGVKWVAQLTLPDGRRKSFSAKTQAEVREKLESAKRELATGLPVTSERQTVAQYLASWLETMRPPRLVPETWSRYEDCIRLHITPALGKTRLTALTPQQVQAFYARLRTQGLSSTTVLHNHAVLHAALKSAVRLGLVARNVTDLVDRPRKRRVEIHPLSASQARRLLETAETREPRLAALYALALAVGMRQGELLALRWDDLDLGARPTAVVRINTTLKWRGTGAAREAVLEHPKSHYSRRQVSLPPSAVESLRRHRAGQLEERLKAGAAYGDRDLVFCDELGDPLTDGRVRRPLFALLVAAGLPLIRFHDLRHTAATLALAARINPKAVSSMLGHASVAFTLDTYAHFVPDMQQDLALTMERVLFA